MVVKEKLSRSITIALPAGRITPGIFAAINTVIQQYGLTSYLTTMQNLRLLDVTEENVESVQKELASIGVQVKAAGQFPLPRICSGKPYCLRAMADTFLLSGQIVARMAGRGLVKPKIKLAIAGCMANCSNALLADIGVVAGSAGFDVYVGGKGGTKPTIGKRILRRVDVEEVLLAIERLIAYHDQKTEKRQRFSTLLREADFPFSPEHP